MDERDDDDGVLNMSTLKELHFRRELTFADTAVIWGLPRNIFSAKLYPKDTNYCGYQ